MAQGRGASPSRCRATGRPRRQGPWVTGKRQPGPRSGPECPCSAPLQPCPPPEKHSHPQPAARQWPVKSAKQLNVKQMTKSGGKRTFPGSIKAAALRGNRWNNEVFVDPNQHLITTDGPSDSGLALVF